MQIPREGQQSPVVTLRGTVEKLVYAKDDFTIGKLRPATGRMVTFCGPISVEPGDEVELHGAWETHPKYGEQFKATAFTFTQLMSTSGLAQWLAGRVQGIGPARAQAIAGRFGSRFEDVVTREPWRLQEVSGVTEEVATAVCTEWKRTKDVNATMVWLAGFSLPQLQITRIVDALGNDAKARLERDPYLLVGMVDGFGFKRTDQIALKMGTPKDSPSRLRAGLLDVVKTDLREGHCWVDYMDLVARATKVLFLDQIGAGAGVERQLDKLLEDGELAAHSASCRLLVALPELLRMEADLWATFAKGGQPNPHAVGIDELSLFAELVQLNDGQREAFLSFLRCRVMALCGGAGSGKTFTVGRMVRWAEGAGLSIALAAPTGKAADRLEEVAKQKAQTIHRLLEWSREGWGRHPGNPLDCDVLIVDEVSMLDVPLAWRLFQAIDPKRTAVVLVGDHNQLPPVGAGNILRDLTERKPFPVVVLDQVVRQAGALKENSLAILSGQVRPTVPPTEGAVTPWVVSPKYDRPEELEAELCRLFEKVLVEKLHLDPLEDVQVLAPQLDGPLGVDHLNRVLQRLVQRTFYGRDIPESKPGKKPPLYMHDKVIQTVNNYDLGVMNGTVGFVCEVGTAQTEFDGGLPRGDVLVDFKGRKVKYLAEKHQPGQLALAYALTIHKFQGSEVPCAIVIVHRLHQFMHHRNLFYTGVTRGKRMVVILGDQRGISNCAKVQKLLDRRTFLSVLEGEARP